MELLRCPFCGSNEIIEHRYEFGRKLSCEKCGSYGPTEICDSNKLWNTRHSPWISIKEKQPNLGELVLIRYKHNDVLCYPKEIIKTSLATMDLYFVSIELNDRNLDPFILIPNKEKVLSLNVIDWLPLPQPPKETE